MPSERFSHFELTDESEGERLDRIPVVKGEIRLADRAYLAAVIDAGGDIVVRAGWRNARWLGADGKPFDLIAALKKAAELGKIDMPVWLGRKGAPASKSARMCWPGRAASRALFKTLRATKPQSASVCCAPTCCESVSNYRPNYELTQFIIQG